MRPRESLLARAVRQDISEAVLAFGELPEPAALRLAWVQAYYNGGEALCWEIPDSYGEWAYDDIIEDIPAGVAVSRDYLADRGMWLRWKTASRKQSREIVGSRIHDGNFDRVEGRS